MTVIVGVVVTAVPEVEPVLIVILKFSVPSVPGPSATNALEKVAIEPVVVPLPTTLNDPVKLLSVKSAATVVPEVLKYSVVPTAIPTALTVNSTDDPSFTLSVDIPTEYDATTSLIVMSSVLVTIPDVVESVKMTVRNVSGPSVTPSRVIVLVTVAIPPPAVPSPTMVNDPEFGDIRSAPTAVVPDAPCSVL